MARNDLKVFVYSDADHANIPDTSRLVTGCVLQLNGCSFQFKINTQKAATDDTRKLEPIAASMCVEQFMWARKRIAALHLKHVPSELRMYNQSTITKEGVHSGAAHTVKAELTRVVTA